MPKDTEYHSILYIWMNNQYFFLSTKNLLLYEGLL